MQIHWHEGLFLQPQHFQRLQHEWGRHLQRERALLLSYPAGIIEGQPSSDELANFRLRYEALRVAMPSGREVNFPQDADLPALDLKPVLTCAKGPVVVYVGLPLWQERRANTIDDGRGADARARLLYRVDEKTLMDENTGENPKTVQIRRLNARLLTDQDDTSDLELLPVARVMLGAEDDVGVPRLDPEFVAPSLFLRSAPVLFSMVRELVAQLDASRNELVLRTTQGGFSIDALHGPQFEQVLRLRTLNRFAGRLPALLEAPNVPPLTWYLELRELLGELAALRPDTDEFSAPVYSHSNPHPAFSHLVQKIRLLLRVKSTSYMKVDFRLDNGVHVGAMTDDHVARPTDYFLGIRTRQEYPAVAALIENGDKFKLLPSSMGVANVAVRGIKLKAERMPPVQLPLSADLHYFRLLRSESAPQIWPRVQRDKAVALRWPGQESSDFQATLYMTLPTQTASP